MNRKRHTHSSAFKAKVALATLQGKKTLSELATQFQVHPNQIQTWKKQLLDNASDLFEKGSGSTKIQPQPLNQSSQITRPDGCQHSEKANP